MTRPRWVGSGDPDEWTPVETVMRVRMISEVATSIRAGRCPFERSFDRFLPRRLRVVSGQYWTPLAVAMRVADWLDDVGVESVVDIGSGAGKFCVATALATQCRFIGLEQRPALVDAASALARTFGVDDRVSFVPAALERGQIPHADAYYLFNPFEENVFSKNERLDDEVELNGARYRHDVALMEDFFEHAPVGTLVIKYNGFGGKMPRSYEKVLVDRDLPNLLRMWRKARPAG